MELFMTLSLRPVTADNYEAICDLDVAPEQEAFVACNMWSLVEAAYNDGHITRGIYLKDKPVGFYVGLWNTKQGLHLPFYGGSNTSA